MIRRQDDGPKEGDICIGPDETYEIYYKGKWKPTTREEVIDPLKPAWKEYISKSFRKER